MKRQISDEEAGAFVKELASRLSHGGEVAFDVTSNMRNKFTLCVLDRCRPWPVKLESDKPMSKYGSYPRQVPVDGLRAIAEERYPDFLIRPGVYTPAALCSKYGIPESVSLRCAYEALARRVNKRGVNAQVSEWVRGKGYVARSKVRLGCSIGEAELRLSI